MDSSATGETENFTATASNATVVDPVSSLYEEVINEDKMNAQATLSIPTYVTKIDNTWFIVDCYHNQVLYYDTKADGKTEYDNAGESDNNNESAGVPDDDENSDDFPQVDLTEWHVLPDDPELPMNQPHTIAGDGNVLLVDDTENNRVLVYAVNDGKGSDADDSSESIGNKDSDAGDSSESIGNKGSDADDSSESIGNKDSDAGDSSESIGNKDSDADDSSESIGNKDSDADDSSESIGNKDSDAGDSSESIGNKDSDNGSPDGGNGSKFTLTQKIDNVGTRPHYTKYDETTKTFYTWSSMTGELYCFKDLAESGSTEAADGSVATDAADGSVAADAADGSVAAEAADGSVATEAADGSVATDAADGSVAADAADGSVAAEATDGSVKWTGTRSIAALNGTYVRSFTIAGDRICFVSGISLTGLEPTVFVCDLDTLEVEKQYSIPDEIAGMVQITPLTGITDGCGETDVSNDIDDAGVYTRYTDDALNGPIIVTVSTDLAGSQDAATILTSDSLEDLSEGKWTDIYDDYFVGGGTPYYVNLVDGRYYLTEHRLTDHAIWSFDAETNDTVGSVNISDVKALY